MKYPNQFDFPTWDRQRGPSLPATSMNMRLSALPVEARCFGNTARKHGSVGSKSTSPWDILDLDNDDSITDPYVFFNHGGGTTLCLDNGKFFENKMFPGGLRDRGFVPIVLPFLTLQSAREVLLLLSYNFDRKWMGGFRFAGVILRRTGVSARPYQLGYAYR